LDGFGSTESDSNEEPVLPRRGSKQSRPRGGTGTNRKISNLSAKESVSGRTSAVGTRWTVVGEDMGDIISVTAEQMANAEKVALDSGLSEDVLIENAGISKFYVSGFNDSAGNSRGSFDVFRQQTSRQEEP